MPRDRGRLTAARDQTGGEPMTETRAQLARDGEAILDHQDIFFSRTDGRGIIQAGNGVFQRVSEHPWAELIGASHMKLPHPDMPEGFFRLFRERLAAGKIMAGYVKHESASGLQYWVYTIATPLQDGGFLSVRVKPSGRHFAPVAAAYAQLRKREQEEGLGKRESARELEARIVEMGHESYAEFIASSLAEELFCRDEARGLPKNARAEQFAQAARAVREAMVHTGALCETFDAIEAVPHNMRILASRLEASGGPIAAISTNYGAMSKEISEWVTQFAKGEGSAFAKLGKALSEARTLSATARVMQEVRARFEEEPEEDSPVNRAEERRQLEAVADHFRGEADKCLATVEREAVVFSRAVSEMKRMIAGLSTTRMMCKIESARLPERNESLMAIIDQLDGFQSRLEERLDRIATITATVLAAARSLELGRRAATEGRPRLARGAA